LADSGAASPAFIPLPSGKEKRWGKSAHLPLTNPEQQGAKGRALWRGRGCKPRIHPLPSGRGQGVGEVRTPPLDKSGKKQYNSIVSRLCDSVNALGSRGKSEHHRAG